MKITLVALAAVLGAIGVAAAADSGKVIVLTTEQLLEGDITRIGDQYRVRRAVGESLIPADQVLKLVQDRQEAYDVIRKRSNPRDPAERMRVARWCLLYGLRAEALAEAEAAQKLRPSDADIQTMVNGLRRLKSAPPPAPEPVPTAPQNAVVEEAASPPDFNSAAYGMFVTKVQPLLMNACASCHAGDKGGNFKLTRVFSGSNNRRGTLLNLSATLQQVNRERPQESALLTYTIAVHGEAARAPIPNAEAPAYRMLERWVLFALAAEGTPNRADPVEELPSGVAVSQEQPKPLPKPPRLPGPRKENIEAPKGRLLGYQSGIFRETPPVTEVIEKKAEPPPTGFAEGSKTKPADKPDAPPADEFDPVIFNNLGRKQ